jgi:hypothetical protein
MRLFAATPLLALLACGGLHARYSQEFSSRVDGEVFSGLTISGDIGIVTDAASGCEYIAIGYREPSLTPRLDHMGQPICAGPADNQIGLAN